MKNNKTKQEKHPPVLPALLTVAASPHQRSRTHVPHLMWRVFFALLPAALFGMVWFGPRAVLVCLSSVLFSVLAEFLFEKFLRKPVTVQDGSAALTGLLLAMNLPYTIPIPMLLLGDLFAIIVVKALFGGLGKNIVNPALAARVFLFISFPAALATYQARPNFSASYADAVTSATPLTALKTGVESSASLSDMLFGMTGGCIGEVASLLLLLGGIYLLVRRIISWHIPVSFLGTVALIAFIFPRAGGRLESVAFALLSGGVILAAFFMATDYVTSPVTARGRLLYGMLCGGITMLIRYFGAYPEGVSFAVLIGNLLVYYIDMWTKPTPFGKKRRGKT